MSDNFSVIWKKRNSTDPEDQTALYLEIRSVFYTSAVIKQLEPKDRDDFFHDFYVNKILHALSAGLVISSKKYDDMSVGQLKYMMRQYSFSCYRNVKNKIALEENKTKDADELQLTDTALDVHQEPVLNDLPENENVLYQQHSSAEQTRKAIEFIRTSESWVLEIIYKSVRGDKLSGNDYPRRAKLGLTLKQSFHTGAKTVGDYHQNTLIGRWIVDTYGEEVLPLSETFFLAILKSLHNAALCIHKEVR